MFDEAHNIDSICIEALSVYLDKRRLKMAANNIKTLKSRVSEMKEADAQKLQQEYNRLVQGLANDNSTVGATNDADGGRASGGSGMSINDHQGLQNPVPPGFAQLPRELALEAVPASIRRADLFCTFLSSVVNYRGRQCPSRDQRNPLKFIHDLQTETSIETKPLKFAYTRLSSLLEPSKSLTCRNLLHCH